MIHGRGGTQPQETNLLSLVYTKHRANGPRASNRSGTAKNTFKNTLSKISMESSALCTDISTDHMSPVTWLFSECY